MQQLFLVLTLLKGLIIHIGGAVCKQRFEVQDDERCKRAKLHFALSAVKKYADIIYPLPVNIGTGRVTRSPSTIENVSDRIDVVTIPAATYLRFYDILLPKEDEPIDTLKASLLAMVAETVVSDPITQIRFGLMPWILSATQSSLSPDWRADNYISATLCQTAERIILAYHMFYITAISISLVFLWSVIRLIQSARRPKPLLSPFSETNLCTCNCIQHVEKWNNRQCTKNRPKTPGSPITD